MNKLRVTLVVDEKEIDKIVNFVQPISYSIKIEKHRCFGFEPTLVAEKPKSLSTRLIRSTH